MKAISLTQPWAKAICLGMKNWETRSWPTAYRGPLAIHAAKGFPKDARDFAAEELPGEMPLGVIVCVCRLTDCQPTDRVPLTDLEERWGDYSPGRYAFKLEDIQVLPTPIPARGALGLWTWESTLQLPAQIAAWPQQWRELYEERAGIKEFDGKLPRPMAEREAESEIRKLAWKENT